MACAMSRCCSPSWNPRAIASPVFLESKTTPTTPPPGRRWRRVLISSTRLRSATTNCEALPTCCAGLSNPQGSGAGATSRLSASSPPSPKPPSWCRPRLTASCSRRFSVRGLITLSFISVVVAFSATPPISSGPGTNCCVSATAAFAKPLILRLSQKTCPEITPAGAPLLTNGWQISAI